MNSYKCEYHNQCIRYEPDKFRCCFFYYLCSTRANIKEVEQRNLEFLTKFQNELKTGKGLRTPQAKN